MNLVEEIVPDIKRDFESWITDWIFFGWQTFQIHDMDLERLPSGKFQTNELVLELTILSYNILRMIGQESPGKRNPHLKRTVKRRRHRTVINNLVNMACYITEHARKLVVGLGKSNVWREVFQYVHYAFEDFVL